MKTNPIGVFDSGLGGLTAVREIQNIMPQEDIVYFGDTGRVPYGSKSRDAISKYARQDARFLKKMGVKILVAACGTVSSVAPDLSEELGLPYTGVVYPTCFTAMNLTKNGKMKDTKTVHRRNRKVIPVVPARWEPETSDDDDEPSYDTSEYVYG